MVLLLQSIYPKRRTLKSQDDAKIVCTPHKRVKQDDAMGRVTVHCYSSHNCYEKEIAYLRHVRLSVPVK